MFDPSGRFQLTWSTSSLVLIAALSTVWAAVSMVAGWLTPYTHGQTIISPQLWGAVHILVGYSCFEFFTNIAFGRPKVCSCLTLVVSVSPYSSAGHLVFSTCSI